MSLLAVQPRCALLLPIALLSAASLQAQDASSTLYVRTDTDHTTVVTPRVHAGSSVGPSTRIDATYTADIIQPAGSARAAACGITPQS